MQEVMSFNEVAEPTLSEICVDQAHQIYRVLDNTHTVLLQHKIQLYPIQAMLHCIMLHNATSRHMI